MAKTVTIKIGVGMPKPSYNLKDATVLKFVDKEATKSKNVLAYIKSHVHSIKASGNDVAFTIMAGGEEFTFNLKNCTSLKTIQAAVKGKNLTSCTFNDLLTAYDACHFGVPASGTSITGSYFNDTIDVSEAQEGMLISSGNGNDKVTGSNYDDTINTGSGKDTIKTSGGNDTINAGKDNDKIYFESGDNIAVFANGDGTDTIYSGSCNDTLKFTGFANLAKLKAGINIAKSGNNLLLKYTSKDSVIIDNFFVDGTSVKKLMANNGNITELETFLSEKSFTFTGTKNKANNITGTSYIDIIKGNNKNDVLNGGNGDDKLYGYVGNDTIKGGNGNDILDGGDGNDKLSGEAGNDTIKGGKGNDSIYGGADDDILYGQDGNDTIKAGEGKDTVYGGKGNDKIYFESGDNVAVFANGDGIDTIYSGSDNDTLKFTEFANLAKFKSGITPSKSGNDLKLAYTSKDSVIIKDFFTSDSSVKTLEAKDGSILDLTEFLNSKKFTFNGAKDKANNITGTSYTDIIKGNNKNDVLNGGGGDDKLYGYAGNDTINGGNGNDTLEGGKGNDKIYTGSGENTVIINKGDGNDNIYHQGTKTTVKINSANAKDIVNLSKSNNNLVLTYTHTKTKNEKTNVKEVITFTDYFNSDGTIKDENIYLQSTSEQKLSDLINSKGINISGSGIIDGTLFNDVITGSSYADTINGNDGNDTIKGGAGNDTINGGNGADVLYGEAGKDAINGNDGNDRIYGGAGDDTINGGNGANTLYFGYGDGNDTIISGGGTDTLVFTNETNIERITAEYVDSDLKINYSGGSLILKDYNNLHSAKYIQVGSTVREISEILPEPPMTPQQKANMTVGTDNADILVQTFGEYKEGVYDNQLNILQTEYGASEEWIEKYRWDLGRQSREVSDQYYRVRNVLQNIKLYEYYIANYDNPNFTGDTYFRRWSKEYYQDELVQANSTAYGATYTWETYRDAKLVGLEEGTAQYEAVSDDLKYSIEYARYQNLVNNLEKYQGYADDITTVPTFRDIAGEAGKQYYIDKLNAVSDNINGFIGSKQDYEALLNTYADEHTDFAELQQNYKFDNTTYQEAYDTAIEEILENNADIKAAYDNYQADLTRFNLYTEYAQNYYNEEYLAKDYINTIEGTNYVSFRQEAEAEIVNKVIHDYGQGKYRYRTGQEYWSYRAMLIDREINGFDGAEARYDYFYQLSRNADPRSMFYDLWREARDEYNDYVDEYNTYVRYINNWNNASYKGESNEDVYKTVKDWTEKIETKNTELNGVVYVYNSEVDKLNALIQTIKNEAPTTKDAQEALQILTHLSTSSGGIIIAGGGDDDITMVHLDPNVENPSYGDVFAMGQGGNDTYRIEHLAAPSSYYTNNIGIEIYDHEGSNTVILQPENLKSGNIGIYANVTLVKNEDGTFAKNPDGSYQYTLENFKSSMTDAGNINSMIERTPLKNGDSGFALLLVDSETYQNGYNFDYGVYNDIGGIKLDVETVNHIDKLYASDGKYITKTQLETMFQNTANMLAERGYESFMDALCLDGVYDDSENRLYNLSALRSSQGLSSLEWIDPTVGVIQGVTTGTTGTNTNDNLISTAANETFDLKLGNDTVTFTGAFGNDVIQSSSTADNNGNVRQTDILNLTEYSVSDGTLKFSISQNDLVMTAYDGETIKGTVTYKDFLSSDNYISRTFILNAHDHTYHVSYNEAQKSQMHNTSDTWLNIDDETNDNYNIRFIRSESNENVRVFANANRGYYYALDNTPLALTTQNGDAKEIFSLGNANDVYSEKLNETTNLIIHDGGGEDTLSSTGTWSTILGDAHMRFFFDLNSDGSVSDAKHIIWKDNFYVPTEVEDQYGYTSKQNFYPTENLIKLLNNDSDHMKGVITIYGDIENIENDNHPSVLYPAPINYNEIIRSIAVDVVPWLKENEYESVTDALTALQAGIDEKQLAMQDIDMSGLERDENGNIKPDTIPEAYTILKNEINTLQGKINELLGFYNLDYENAIERNMFGTDGDDKLTTDSYYGTKYIEAGKGNDIINTYSTSPKIIYDFVRGDGHDTILDAHKGNSICIKKGSSDLYTKFRTEGWDLKIEFYSDNKSTENPKGSITLNDYFKKSLNDRLDKIVFIDDEENETEESIDTLLRTKGVLNAEHVFFGTGENNEIFEPTNGNDIIYNNDGWNSTIPSSKGDDILYLTDNALIKYTLGDGNDTIYRGESNYYDNHTLYFDYGTTDVSVEFRRLPNEGDVPDDLKILFFNEDAQKVGSLTIKGYFYNFLTESVPERQLHKLTIKQNGIETTGLSLTDMLTDYINSGASLVPNNDVPYYNIIRINGNTVLNNSGKVDRLIFEDVDNFADLTSSINNDNLVITYDDKTVIIKGYKAGNSSVYDVRVNGEYKTLGDLSGFYYGTNGDDVFVHSTEENVTRYYNLNKGNDIVEFPVTKNTWGVYENGDKIYNKAVINSVKDTTPTTDTIKLKDYQANELIFGYTDDGSGITIKADKDYNPTTLVNYHKYTDITYNNFITGNTPDLSVESYNEIYIINKYNGVQNIEYDSINDAGVYADYIQATTGTSKVRLKDNVQILTNGGANLEATTWGSDYNIITTHSETSNDTYCVYNSDYSNLRIFDNGGNDTIRLYNSYKGDENEWTDATSDNLRLLFNVEKDGTTDNSFIIINHNNNGADYIQNEARLLMTGHATWYSSYGSGDIIIDAKPKANKSVGIENLILCKTENIQDEYGDWNYSNTAFAKVNLESWYNAVKADVQSWLNSNGRTYDSTAEVFENGYNDSSNADFISLMNVYDKSATNYLTNV